MLINRPIGTSEASIKDQLLSTQQLGAMKLEFSQAGKLPAKVKDQVMTSHHLTETPAAVTSKDEFITSYKLPHDRTDRTQATLRGLPVR